MRSFVLFGNGVQHVAVVAAASIHCLLWTVFIALFECEHILPEDLFALLAGKYHLIGLFERVIFHFVVAVCTIEPFLAAGCTDGRLDVEDVLAHEFNLNVKEYRLFQIDFGFIRRLPI